MGDFCYHESQGRFWGFWKKNLPPKSGRNGIAKTEALPRCGNGDGYFQTLAINKEYTPV